MYVSQPVGLYSCAGSDNQGWYFDSQSMNLVSSSGLCLVAC
jgi:hypothetical protein